MGFIFESVNNTRAKSEVGLGISLTSDSKLFPTLYDLSKQAKENLKFLLLTQIGERYMLPNFGCDLLSVIFQPNVNELKEDIIDIISTATNIWLPYIKFDAIDIKTNEDDPTLEHTVRVVLTFSVSEFDPQSISILVNNSTLTVS